jgi:hypothetical protein
MHMTYAGRVRLAYSQAAKAGYGGAVLWLMPAEALEVLHNQAAARGGDSSPFAEIAQRRCLRPTPLDQIEWCHAQAVGRERSDRHAAEESARRDRTDRLNFNAAFRAKEIVAAFDCGALQYLVILTGDARKSSVEARARKIAMELHISWRMIAADLMAALAAAERCPALAPETEAACA